MNNKVYKIIIWVFMIGFFLTGCEKENADLENESFASVYIKKDPDCNNELELYYTDENDIKYYSVCLTEINLKFNDKEISLKEEIQINPTIMEEITSKLTLVDVAKDGGTKIYKDFGYSEVAYSELGNVGFTIIKCNSMHNELIDGKQVIKYNQDYYFGDLLLTYEEGYCNN